MTHHPELPWTIPFANLSLANDNHRKPENEEQHERTIPEQDRQYFWSYHHICGLRVADSELNLDYLGGKVFSRAKRGTLDVNK